MKWCMCILLNKWPWAQWAEERSDLQIKSTGIIDWHDQDKLQSPILHDMVRKIALAGEYKVFKELICSKNNFSWRKPPRSLHYYIITRRGCHLSVFVTLHYSCRFCCCMSGVRLSFGAAPAAGTDSVSGTRTPAGMLLFIFMGARSQAFQVKDGLPPHYTTLIYSSAVSHNVRINVAWACKLLWPSIMAGLC